MPKWVKPEVARYEHKAINDVLTGEYLYQDAILVKGSLMKRVFVKIKSGQVASLIANIDMAIQFDGIPFGSTVAIKWTGKNDQGYKLYDVRMQVAD